MKYSLLILILAVVHYLAHAQYTEQDDALNYLRFTVNSYKTIFDASTNFVYSPLSINAVYNVLYQISSGNAEIVLQATLFPMTSLRSVKYDILQNQVERLSLITRTPSIRLANKFYLGANTEFDKIFKYLAERYQTECENIDFNKTELARITINKWVENKTKGQITDLLQGGQIQPYTNIININTASFKAEWLNKFTEFNIHDGIFNTIYGSKVPVKFIEDVQTYDISFRPTLGLYALRLPYTNGLEFWIILPLVNYQFVNFVQSLTVDTIYDIKHNFLKTYAHIKFPIFTIESRLNGMALKPEAFFYPDYQFKTGIRSIVGTIIQKAKIMVTADGTAAGLGTYTIPVNSSRFVPPVPFYFTADRPFVYAVIADGNLPIFLGHYTS